MSNSHTKLKTQDGIETITVEKTRRLDLCLCCEICPVVCPVEAITMEFDKGMFLPEIDYDKCTHCGLCLKLCPGIDVDPRKLRNQSYSKNIFNGPVINSLIAHSNDSRILRNSSSGGLITHLIVELIKNKEFDRVFVLDFDKFDGTAAWMKGTDNIDEILKATKSKYVPVSVQNIIKAIVSNKGKYIIVGTACQFQGIKKYLQHKNISEDNILFLGLFCDGTLNFNLMRHLENIYRKKTEQLTKFDFRNKEKEGWPGDLKFSFNSGRELFIDKDKRIRLKRFFRLNRCQFCLDKLNIFADIAFGDCYIKDKTDFEGRSNIIIRTDKGQAIFNKYRDLFKTEDIGADEIRNSQGMARKKTNLENVRILVTKCDIYENKDSNFSINKWAAKKLLISQKFIQWGQNNNTARIRIIFFLSKLASILKAAIKTLRHADKK